MSHCYYLAYGSNLHPLRLAARLPHSELLTSVVLPGYRLCFHKHGGDDSGKCDLLYDGSGQLAYGALYRMRTIDVARLDMLEGGYHRVQLSLHWQGQSLEVFTYQARADKITPGIRPFQWYQQLVLAGAEYLNFPQSYLENIAREPLSDDPNQARRETHLQLLDQISQHRQHSPWEGGIEAWFIDPSTASVSQGNPGV